MERALRFCMITTFYPPYSFGGDGMFVQELSNELARCGNQVDVIHCIDAYRALTRQVPSSNAIDHQNVTVHRLKSRFGLLSPLLTQQTGLPFLKQLPLRRILAKKYDVIHYHNISLIGGPKILKYGKGLKLYTMHEYWLMCPTHHLLKFNRRICIRRACFLCTLSYCRPPQWWRYSRLLDGAVKYVDAFIAPSLFLKAKLRQRGFNGRIEHIPNFISQNIYKASPDDQNVSITREGPYFLFVGRLEKGKGLHTIIPVFKRYRRARLLIAGSGEHKSHLHQLATDAPNIEFLGHMAQQRLFYLYRNAVALIVPSILYEIFPLVILESFKEKTPVILRNIGSLPEIIEESGAGFLYDTNEDLIAIMDHLLTHPDERKRMGLNGYNTYKQRWTTEAHLKRYLSLICEMSA